MPINLREYLFSSGTSLVLHGVETLTDTDFAQLRDFSDEQRQSITVVVLSNTHISGECFRHLALLGNLKALYCGGTQVEDNAPFDLLSKTIEIINLDRTDIGDRCILRLTKLTRLRSLSLRETRVTDSGLHLLSAMPSLREYCLDGTSTSDYAKQRLDNTIQSDAITFAKALYILQYAIRLGAGKLIRFAPY